MEPSGLRTGWPPACHAGALPAELWPHYKFFQNKTSISCRLTFPESQNYKLLPVALINNSTNNQHKIGLQKVIANKEDEWINSFPKTFYCLMAKK